MHTVKNKTNSDKCIAYIAPEIPALSATFVYQEILQLKRMGAHILPISIHRPAVKATGNTLTKLGNNTYYLYEQSFLKCLCLNAGSFIAFPAKYMSTFWMTLSDAVSVGLRSHVGKGLIYRFYMAGALAGHLKNYKVSHIHSNFAHIPTDIAMYTAGIMGVKFSFTSHANDLFERGWLLKNKVSRSDFAVTISEYNKCFLIEMGAAEKKINVIHCGVDTQDFSTRDDKQLGAPPLLGALGRMVEKKGFDDLILACDLLKRKGIEFQLQIAGDGPLLNNLKELAREKRLTGNIEFIGIVPHEKVPHWLKSLDVFVLPCKVDKNGDMDGIPVVLMEAMLSGVPVMSTRTSGIPELVIDGETGLLFNANSSRDIADKFEVLISEYNLAKKRTIQAIVLVNNEFSLFKNTLQLLKLFQ